jgi:hypothetical protein
MEQNPEGLVHRAETLAAAAREGLNKRASVGSGFNFSAPSTPLTATDDDALSRVMRRYNVPQGVAPTYGRPGSRSLGAL